MIDPLIIYIAFLNFIFLVFIIGCVIYILNQAALERSSLTSEFSHERKELIKAILAKDLQDLTTSEIMNKTEEKDKPEELMVAEDMNEKEFDEAIRKQLERAQ